MRQRNDMKYTVKIPQFRRLYGFYMRTETRPRYILVGLVLVCIPYTSAILWYTTEYNKRSTKMGISEYNDKFLDNRSNTMNSRRGDVRMTKSKLIAPVPLQMEIVKELNEAALYLFSYYVRKITNPVLDLSNDKITGKSIGWTARKVKDYRLRLTNAGYIYFHTIKKDYVTYNTWCITKEEVELFKSRNNSVNRPTIVVTESGGSVKVSVDSQLHVKSRFYSYTFNELVSMCYEVYPDAYGFVFFEEDTIDTLVTRLESYYKAGTSNE